MITIVAPSTVVPGGKFTPRPLTVDGFTGLMRVCENRWAPMVAHLESVGAQYHLEWFQYERKPRAILHLEHDRTYFYFALCHIYDRDIAFDVRMRFAEKIFRESFDPDEFISASFGDLW
ncbi:MAG: hypothetical protein EOO77_16765 [Oxalobacteraceae bacterium]|nr:MAG: hypothetical protein EOO77_16765 [Oxalobacteraceae bacterium]